MESIPHTSVAVQALAYLKSHSTIAIIATIILHLTYVRYASPLRKIPGPFLASISRLWQVWTASTLKAEEIYIAAHEKYGPIVRIGPNEVSFASPSAANDVFKTGKGFHKTDFYRVFLPKPVTDIFTETREEVHATKKRIVSPFYSIASVQEHTAQIEQLMWKFLGRLDDFAAAGGTAECDLGSWLHFLAFDVLGEFAFAKSFGFLDAATDVDNLISAISTSTHESSIIAQLPIVEDMTRSNPLWKYFPFKLKNKMSSLVDTAVEVLGKYQGSEESDQKTKCLLKSLLAAHSSNPERFSTTDVLSISMGAIAAGSDSTASTMHTFCWQVLSNPAIRDKLVSEILEAPLSDTVAYQEGLSLPFFQACLKEAMRLQPAFAMNVSRKIPPGGAVVAGTYLPEDSSIALNAWVIHRDKQTFGADADRFNPHRWIDNTEEQLKIMDRAMMQASNILFSHYFFY